MDVNMQGVHHVEDTLNTYYLFSEVRIGSKSLLATSLIRFSWTLGLHRAKRWISKVTSMHKLQMQAAEFSVIFCIIH